MEKNVGFIEFKNRLAGSFNDLLIDCCVDQLAGSFKDQFPGCCTRNLFKSTKSNWLVAGKEYLVRSLAPLHFQ